MIDKDYAKEQLQVIGNEIMDASFRYCKDVDMASDFEEQRGYMFGETIMQLWECLAAQCEAYNPDRNLLTMEDALGRLVHKGMEWSKVSVQEKRTVVQLKWLRYALSKQKPGFMAAPCVIRRFYTRPKLNLVTLSGDDFANFLYEFDELVPLAEQNVCDQILGIRIRVKQYEILCQSIDTIGEQLLRPHGITWKLMNKFTDDSINVEFDAEGKRPMRRKILIEDMIPVFEGIPDQLENQSEKKG